MTVGKANHAELRQLVEKIERLAAEKQDIAKSHTNLLQPQHLPRTTLVFGELYAQLPHLARFVDALLCLQLLYAALCLFGSSHGSGAAVSKMTFCKFVTAVGFAASLHYGQSPQVAGGVLQLSNFLLL